MIGYKITDKNDQTYGGCQWGEGVIHEAPGTGELCDDGWIHYYDDPVVAVLMNPIHGNFNLKTAHLWEVKVEGKIETDHGLKFGCTQLTTIRRIELPKVSIEQAITFGILCGKAVCSDSAWNQWADDWLSGKDRSRKAAAEVAATRAAVATAWAAAWAAWDAVILDLKAIAQKAMEVTPDA